MTPELSQVLFFGLLSFLFLAIGIGFRMKKWLRSLAVNANAPCVTYLKMKFEAGKLFDATVADSSDSRFNRIRNHIR